MNRRIRNIGTVVILGVAGGIALAVILAETVFVVGGAR